MDKVLIPSDLDTEKDLIKDELDELDLSEFVSNMFKDIDLENRDEELKRQKKWAKNRAYYRGDQRGFWDTKTRTWQSIDIDTLAPSDASLLVINNQFRPQVKTLAKEFSRSLTRIRTNSLSDSQEAVMASRFSDALIKYHQPKSMTESQRQLEAKYMLLCGNAFRYIYYSKDKKSVPVDIPVMGKRILEAYESTVCTECGEKVEDKDIFKCPKCGGLLEDISVPEKEIDAITGYESVNSGDIQIEVVDPIEVKVWAGAATFEESPYTRRKRVVKENFLKNTYPFLKLTKKSSLSEYGQDQLKFNDNYAKSDYVNSNLHEYDQLWLEPSYYTHCKLKKPVSFKIKQNGKWIDFTLEAGTVLREIFPDGLYVCRVGTDIITYYNENKNKCWEHLPFDISTDGVWADGLEDSVMNQQIINEYTSLSVENVLYNASPKLVVNPSLVNPVSITGKPKDMILMSDNARKEQPRNAIHQLQGMSLTQEVHLGIESSKRDMREQTGALLAFNGQGDPNIQTATGMSIARDSALALISTPLAIRAEKDLSTGWKILNLVKENWYDNKYKFLLGKYNESEANAFKKANLEETINLYIEPYSWMPQTNFERLENLGAYLTAFNLPLGFLNPNIPETVRTYASQLYNIPFDFDELAPDRRIAQKRLDKAREFTNKSIVDIEMKGMQLIQSEDKEGANALFNLAKVQIANLMDVEEDIDDHAVFIDMYIKWLKTDEGQNAHPILREAIKETIASHKAFLQTQEAEAAENSAIMNGGTPPQMNGMQGAWDANTPAESPFNPPKAGAIVDFSGRAGNKL